MAGHVKIQRDITQWGWYKDEVVRSVYLHMIFKANYKDSVWMGHTIKRGQYVNSAEGLAAELGGSMTRQKVRTAWKKLLSTNDIVKESTNGFTIITLCNYDKWQTYDGRKQPTDNQRITNEQPTDNQRITTIKESKEYKEDKEYNLMLTREAEIEEIEKMKVEDGLLESVAMLNKISKAEVLVKLGEFLAHLTAGDYKHNKGQLRNHFRDWCRKRIQDEKTQQQKQATYGNNRTSGNRGSYEPTGLEDYSGERL